MTSFFVVFKELTAFTFWVYLHVFRR